MQRRPSRRLQIGFYSKVTHQGGLNFISFTFRAIILCKNILLPVIGKFTLIFILPILNDNLSIVGPNAIVDSVGLQIQYELHQNGVISMHPCKTPPPTPPPKACTSPCAQLKGWIHEPSSFSPLFLYLSNSAISLPRDLHSLLHQLRLCRTGFLALIWPEVWLQESSLAHSIRTSIRKLLVASILVENRN